MRIVAFRTGDERDRVYVHLDDGSEVTWSWGPYGDALPHDLVHWVVETRTGITDGFWGMVGRGMDPHKVAKAAERIAAGSLLHDATGPDTSSLVQAELVTNAIGAMRWQAVDDAYSALVRASTTFGVELPDGLDAEGLGALAVEVDSWATRWRALWPGDSLEVQFPDPELPPPQHLPG